MRISDWSSDVCSSDLIDGLFGIASSFAFWPGFAAHAIDRGQPFISETGYRGFLGIHAEPVPGLTPDAFTAKVIASHIKKELKGRLLPIAPQYRPRRAGAARKNPTTTLSRASATHGPPTH